MSKRIRLPEHSDPDSLRSGAIKVNENFDEIESDGWVTTNRLSDESVTTEKIGNISRVNMGLFQLVFNSTDNSLDIESNAAGIPYTKTDSTFSGSFEFMEAK